MKNYFNEKCRWENYKGFFHLVVFRYLVMWFSIVPIIAGLVSQLPDPLVILISGKCIPVSLDLPFNWELLWLSSLFFVFALGLYHLNCPDFIKKYNNYSDYAACSHDHRWLAWEASRMWSKVENEQKNKFVMVLCDTKKIMTCLEQPIAKNMLETPQIEEKQTVFYLHHKEKYYSLGLPHGKSQEEKEEFQVGIFHEIFGRYTSSNKFVRAMISILLLISFLLFLSVLSQHIYHGGQHAIQWFFGDSEVINTASDYAHSSCITGG